MGGASLWGAKEAGYLVSPRLRKVWYSCKKNCLGTRCSPSRFWPKGLWSGPSPVRPEAPPTGPQGPPAHAQPPKTAKVNPRRGHYTAFRVNDTPCHYFHLPGKTIWRTSRQRDPLVPPRPSGRPCCNWLAAVSVTVRPAPHHADSTTIGPRPCPSPEAYLDLPDANGDGSGRGETFDDGAGDEVQQEPWRPRGTLSWSRRPRCMEAADGHGPERGCGWGWG